MIKVPGRSVKLDTNKIQKVQQIKVLTSFDPCMNHISDEHPISFQNYNLYRIYTKTDDMCIFSTLEGYIVKSTALNFLICLELAKNQTSNALLSKSAWHMSFAGVQHLP